MFSLISSVMSSLVPPTGISIPIDAGRALLPPVRATGSPALTPAIHKILAAEAVMPSHDLASLRESLKTAAS